MRSLFYFRSSCRITSSLKKPIPFVNIISQFIARKYFMIATEPHVYVLNYVIIYIFIYLYMSVYWNLILHSRDNNITVCGKKNSFSSTVLYWTENHQRVHDCTWAWACVGVFAWFNKTFTFLSSCSLVSQSKKLSLISTQTFDCR